MNEKKPESSPPRPARPDVWKRYGGRLVEASTSSGDVIKGRLVEATMFELVLETLQGVVILHKAHTPVVRVR